MNIINILRKPYLAMFLASLMLFASCSQYEDNTQTFDNTSLNIAKNQLNNFNLNSEKSSDIAKNHQIMDYLQEKNNVSVEFSESLYELNNKTTDKKISIALQSGVLNQNDLLIIQNLEISLKNGNFENVISNFEIEIINLNFSSDKFEIYNTFVNSLKLINNLDPVIFSADSQKSLDCVLATIGFAAAAEGLVILLTLFLNRTRRL